MHHWLEFSLFCFTSLFTMVNPLGVIPVYTAITHDMPPTTAQKIASKASLTAVLTLVVFALGGRFIFQFFSISVDSLKIVGGVIFFLMGYEMLQARLSRLNHKENSPQSLSEFGQDIAITPLAIPMICGPGAITTAMLLMNATHSVGDQLIVFLMIGLLGMLTFVFLVSGKRIVALLGRNGNEILMRLMGLIVMVIAVEFFFAGLKGILSTIHFN